MKKYVWVYVLVLLLCFFGVGLWYRSILFQTAPVAAIPLPDTIFIRGNRWEVVESEKIDVVLDKWQDDGNTDCKDETIFVHTGLPHSEESNVIWHELLHAGTCDPKTGRVDNSFWNSNDPFAHRGIYRLGEYFSELFRENPDLVRYLSQ